MDLPFYLNSAGIIFCFILTGFCLVVVPQGKNYVVERFGKYNRTLNPGLRFVIPFVEKVAHKVLVKDLVYDIPSQEIITKDNTVLVTNAIAYVRIHDPYKACYEIHFFESGIIALIQTTLRSVMGEMSLDEALASRDIIKSKLKSILSTELEDWGAKLKSVEIQDISPSKNMRESMERQAASERLRRAAITEADGKKQATIMQSEAELESSRRLAESKIVLANAEAESRIIEAKAQKESLQNIFDLNNESSTSFLISQEYVKAMRDLARSPNSKVICIPGDISGAVASIFKK